MIHLLRRPRVALAPLLALLTLTGGVAAEDPASRTPTEAALELLRTSASGEGVDGHALGVQLAAFGPETIPLLFAALDTGIVPADDGPLVLADVVTSALWSSFAHFNVGSVRGHLATLADERFGERTRSHALQLLGGVGSAQDFGLLARLAAPEGVHPTTTVRQPFAYALARLLQRDPGALRWIDSVYDSIHESLRPTLLSTIARSEAPDRLVVLASLLGRVRDADVHVLRELESIASSGRGTTDEYVCGSVRGYLAESDTALVQAAAQALGALRDEGAIPGLIDLLRDEDAFTAPSAVRALTAICRYNFGSDADRWQRWYQGEKAWWRHEASDVFSDLRDSDPGVVAAAVQQLSTRTLYREELATSLLVVLERPEPTLRMLACVSLGSLGAEGARPALSKLLEDEDPAVRSAAQAAVSKLSFRIIPAR